MIYAAAVCGGRLNSKFSSRVAAITCISMMLKDKIRDSANGSDKQRTQTAIRDNREPLPLCKRLACRQYTYPSLWPELTEIWATT